jgi:hypothetical protein
MNYLEDETARFVEEFTKNEGREPTEEEVAKFRENVSINECDDEYDCK